MTAYYNEFDPKAAAWLRELIQQGHIADGIVDERSISDVRPSDLAGFTQCHFFAGIGVWSYALRRAGWADDRPVWTGSCPCQPFSAAGKGAGVADERHLWPHWHHLIRECRPAIVFGEQVASKDGLGWLDIVSTDMEAENYAIGAADLCAAGVGAPHIRQRLFFGAVRLADAKCSKRGSVGVSGLRQADGAQRGGTAAELAGGRDGGRLADADFAGKGVVAASSIGLDRWATRNARSGHRGGSSNGGLEHTPGDGRQQWRTEPSGWCAVSGRSDCRLADADDKREVAAGNEAGAGDTSWTGINCGLADAHGGQRGRIADGEGCQPDGAPTGWQQGDSEPERGGADCRPSPTHNHWRDADWLFCRDGKWRPVEPGTFPLAHGAAQRVGRLRGYGNAIVAQVAQTFIEAWM